MRYPRYDREAPLSYALGVFPTLELLQHQPRQVREVLFHSSGLRNDGLGKIRTLCNRLYIPLTQDDKLVERLATKENTYAIGVLEKYTAPIDTQFDQVVLVNPSDMGNLGTTLRTMLGFGFHDLALIRPAVDLFDPRVIRASMGAVFQMRFTYFEDMTTYQSTVPQHTAYALMTDGRQSLRETDFQSPFTLWFGNESSGLPAEVHTWATTVTIPQSSAIDSLNLSIAIGITLYAASGRNKNRGAVHPPNN
jgi:TrmH family RNA methyltransferase